MIRPQSAVQQRLIASFIPPLQHAIIRESCARSANIHNWLRLLELFVSRRRLYVCVARRSRLLDDHNERSDSDAKNFFSFTSTLYKRPSVYIIGFSKSRSSVVVHPTSASTNEQIGQFRCQCMACCSCGSCEPAVTRGMVPHEVELWPTTGELPSRMAHTNYSRTVSCAQSVVHNFLFSVGAPCPQHPTNNKLPPQRRWRG